MDATASPASKPSPPNGEQAILETAKRLFAASGFEGVSMRDVAQGAGVSKANIYHHFSSKEDLYVEVCRGALAEGLDHLELLNNLTEDFDATLAAYARQHLRRLMDDPSPSALFLKEALEACEERGRMLAQTTVRDYFANLTKRLRSAQRAGHIRSDIDPAIIAMLLEGANVLYVQFRGIMSHVPEADALSDPDIFHEQMLKVLMNGFCPRPAGEVR